MYDFSGKRKEDPYGFFLFGVGVIYSRDSFKNSSERRKKSNLNFKICMIEKIRYRAGRQNQNKAEVFDSKRALTNRVQQLNDQRRKKEGNMAEGHVFQ